MSDVEITGYHGTNIPNYQEIKRRRFFNISFGNEHYLGNGIYFFIDDYTENGKINAASWAKKRPGDKKCVIQVQISFNEKETLDLTTKEGLANYYKTYKEIIRKIKGVKGKKFTGEQKSISGTVINSIYNAADYNEKFIFVKAWTSTHFNELSDLNAFTAISNGCELCVRNNTKIITKTIKGLEVK